MAAAITPAVLAAAGEDYVIYRTRAGDTLIGIGRTLLARPGDWVTLQRVNRVEHPERMSRDLPLRIPARLLRRTSVPARVENVIGGATRDGSPARPGAEVAEGAQLATAGDGYLTLRLADGSRLTLQPASRLRLDRHRTLPSPLGVDARASLHQGRVEAQTTPRRQGTPRQELRLPAAVISVRGTRYRAGAGEAGRSLAEVTEGQIAVVARGAERALSQGYGVALVPGEAPPAPVALLPAPDTAGLDEVHRRITLELRFPPLAGAAGYRAQVAEDADFQRVVGETRAPAPPLKLAAPPDGRYWLRLRGIDARGLEGIDALARLTIDARPEPPFPSAPADGAKLRGEPPRFVWTAAAEATAYDFQLAADPAFDRIVASAEKLPATGHALPEAPPPGDYWWRVASLRADGKRGPWGDPLRLLMRPAPAAPEPPAVDEQGIGFAWPAEPGQRFEFELAADPQFADVRIAQRLDEPRVRIERPAAGTYYVRVRATDPDGYVGPYTAAQRFEVPPPRPWWLLLLLLVPALL